MESSKPKIGVISAKKIFPISPDKDSNAQRIAYAISLVFHPILLPSLFLGVLFYVAPSTMIPISNSLKWPFLGIIFIMTFVFPACITAIILLWQSGKQNQANEYGDFDSMSQAHSSAGPDLQMKSIEDRKLVFVLTSIIYVIATALFKIRTFEVIPILTILLGAITLSLFALTIVTFFWKISAHSVGVSGTLGLLFGLSYKYGEGILLYPVLGGVVVCGLVMTARLYLDAHSPNQIAAGFCLGFVTNFSAIMLLL